MTSVPFYRQAVQVYRGALAMHMGLILSQIPALIQDARVGIDGSLTIIWKKDAESV